MTRDYSGKGEKGDISKILCPFCSTPWTEKMIDVYGLSTGCDTCGDYSITLDIHCESCKRLIYRKEVQN